MITLTDVSMGFGGQQLYRDVRWQLRPGGHYGLVGANGSGKSTLLRLMSGELRPDRGTVERPATLRVGTLGQDQFRFDAHRVLDVVLMGRPALWAAVEERERLLREHPGEMPAAVGERLGELEMAIAEQQGYDADARAATLLVGLGLGPERHDRPMRELSGGFRLRVLLAQTLFSEPDLLLLDEPTNHLDIASTQWLEGYLRAFTGTICVISHDRHFLNAVCDTIADVDYGELRLYPGDYDAFEHAKELATAQREAEIERTEAKIEEMQQFIDRFRAKATKARQTSARKKQVERIELPEVVRSSRRMPGFHFDQVRPSGREVVVVQGLAKSYGDHRVLTDVDVTIERGERVAVVGPNGIGKSTLLQILLGRIPADAGTVTLGYEVQPGYFAQDVHDALRGEESAYDWLATTTGEAAIGTLRGTLGRVLFSGDEALKRIGDLSGGESARLLLAALMIQQPNLLVLDEPTNHLDLEGREALRRALVAYPGTVIFVSHDRHFVEGVGTRVLALTPAGSDDFHGTYAEYLERRGADYLATGQAATTRERRRDRPAPAGREIQVQQREQRRALERLQRRVDELEQAIERLEGEIATVDGRFSDNDYYARASLDELRSDERRRDELRVQLEETVAEWDATARDLESRLARAAAGGES